MSCLASDTFYWTDEIGGVHRVLVTEQSPWWATMCKRMSKHCQDTQPGHARDAACALKDTGILRLTSMGWSPEGQLAAAAPCISGDVYMHGSPTWAEEFMAARSFWLSVRANYSNK